MFASRVQPRPRSFRTLVLVGMVGVVLAAMCSLAALLNYQSGRLAADLARALLGQKLDQVRSRVDELLTAAERQGRVCLQLAPQGMSADNFLEVFRQLTPAFMQQPEFTYLGYAVEETGEYAMLERFSENEFRLRLYRLLPSGERLIQDFRFQGDGFVAIATHPWDNYDPRTRPFYTAARQAGTPLWTPAYVFRGNERRAETPGVTYAVPVHDAGGKLRGVWDVDFDTYTLAAFVKVKADPQAGYAFIVEERSNGERLLIAHPDSTNVVDESRQLVASSTMHDPVVRAFLGSMGRLVRRLPSDEVHRFTNNDTDYLGAYAPLPAGRGPAWLVAVVMPEDYALTRVEHSRMWALILGVGVTAGAVALAVWIAGRLARPIENLRLAVDGLAGDGQPQPVPTDGPFELARLAQAFNAMLESVETRRRELLGTNRRLQEEVRQRGQREAELEAVFANAPVEIWVVDLSGRYTLQSQRLRQRFGDCVGKMPEELGLPPELRAQYSSNNQRALAGEVVHGETAEAAGGQTAYFHWIVVPIRMGALVTGALGVSIDVTERRRAEDALMRSQQRLRLHLENTPLAVIDWSNEFTVLSWNPSAEAVFGWTATEAMGRHGLFIVPETERSTVRTVWADLQKQRGGSRHYNQNVTKDGRTIDCEWYNTILTDDNDRVIGVSSLVLDVSQRISAETLFRESEERFLKAFTDSPVAKLITRRDDGRIIDANERFAQMIDCRREDMIGRTTLELNFWQKPADRLRYVELLRRDGEVRDMEYQLKPRTGPPVDVLISAAAVPLGKDFCLLTTCVDNTERRAAEKALRESQRFLSTLISHLPGMVYRCRNDENWTMTFVSDGAKDLTGYSPAEIEHNRGVAFASLIHPDDRERLQNETQAAFAGGRLTFNFEYRLIHRNGDVRWVWERGGGQRDEHGNVSTMIGFVTDISERRSAEDEVLMLNLSLERRVADRTAELGAANEKLKELDRLKSEFLATMSHELRTPLNSIIGFSTLLHRGAAGPLNAEQEKQLGMVNASALHLLTLINDLLDLSRIESGRMELFPEEFVLAEVLHDVETTLAPMVGQKRLTYWTVVGKPGPVLRTDRKRVFQVILNLANNAVKFTETGGVTVECTQMEDEVRVAVRDTGIGIKPEHMPMLFEAFRQIDGSARRVYEGTGLGLHLCRKLLDMLGGAIEVKSVHGEGSCFTVKLPAASAGTGKETA